MIDRIKLQLGWRVTCNWLRKAETMIRHECDHELISHWLAEFGEFIEHNELECALNMLEEACEHFTPSSNIWSLMADAASSMKLEKQEQLFRLNASITEHRPITL